MSGNLRAQQSLAERFATVLRLFEAEGGDVTALADRVDEEPRDLRRWADGTKMPAHVLSLLLGELPRHLADRLIQPTGLRLVARDASDSANALMAASKASQFACNVTERKADGVWDHRDEAATQEDARRLIADLQPLAKE
jgi:hypothetical protein